MAMRAEVVGWMGIEERRKVFGQFRCQGKMVLIRFGPNRASLDVRLRRNLKTSQLVANVFFPGAFEVHHRTDSGDER